jgi:hypothetical protein
MDPVAEIARLYYTTTKATIQRDLARAITLFKQLSTEAERERVAVYLDGLSQMRSEWGVCPARAGQVHRTRTRTAAKRPNRAGTRSRARK